MRPDESKRLQVRGLEIVDGGGRRQRILHIAVRANRGTGRAKSMPGAVMPFTRLVKRHNLGATDLIFSKLQRELFKALLIELDLKKAREGNMRTFYSLRHTNISKRELVVADIYQIAKNCRTGIEVIDAEAVDVRKAPKRRR